MLKLRPVPCEQSAAEGPWGDQGGDVGEGTLGTRRCAVALGAHLDKEPVCPGLAGTRGSVPAESGEPGPGEPPPPRVFIGSLWLGCVYSAVQPGLMAVIARIKY